MTTPGFSFSQDMLENKEVRIQSNNLWFIDAGRQALLSLHYERNVQIRKNFLMSAHFGLGGIPGNHDTIYSGLAGHYTIFTGVTGLIGMYPFYLEIGLDPQIYFVEKTSFCNLDGNFGLRYQNFRKGKIFLQISYTPILYTTHTNDFDIPFSFSIGECF